jgi:hypothetical protein
MHYVAKRFGLRPTRGWIALFIIVMALAAGVFWVGPFTAGQPQLRLVALSGDGRFHEEVAIPSEWATALPAASEATARIPLIVAVHNAGLRGGQPQRLSLSLPARFRVSDGRGQPFRAHATMGNPLMRYDFPINAPNIQPGRLPTIIAGLDTLWLEAVIPSIYCTALADSVPEFVSAPPQNAQLQSEVRIFYSFTGERIRERQTGLLTIQVDPELVRREPARTPPTFATQVIRPEAPRPLLDELRYVGARNTWCGDPGRPLKIFDTLWETSTGGRFFVLYHGEVPRKYLFDLDRDSIIELEMWDHDGDGQFESRRAARLTIPAFLMPYPEPAVLAAATDTAASTERGFALDSAATTPAWIQMFYDTAAGPLRFSGTTRAASQPPAAVVPQVDAAWLRLFNQTSAGPLRFYRALMGEPPPPPPRVDTGPKLLGVPIEEKRALPRAPADTLRDDSISLR